MKAKLFLFLSLVVLTFGGCKKDNDDSSSGGSTGLKVKTSLSGRIFDESGIAVSGATVMAGNVTAITDQYGIYTIADVELAKERAIVTINKGGYWQQVGSCIPSAGTTTYRNFTLFNGSSTQVVNGASGGTVTHSNGGSVTFPANAFVTASGTSYSGNVNVCMHRIAADDSKLGLKLPGSDLLAIDASNENVILITYGMIGVKLTDGSGNTIKIADGKKASIKFPIAVGQLSSAPATIDLWYFDESIGKWKEEGIATKVGNNYEGDVAHFSWWNCDLPNPRAYINGRVVDCLGNPLPQAYVGFKSTNYYGSIGISDGNGNYSGAVPANENMTITAYYNSNFTYDSSQTQSGLPLLNSTTTLNDFQINTTLCTNPAFWNITYNVTGRTVDCNYNAIPSTVIFLDSLNNYISHQYTPNGVFSTNLPNGNFRMTAYSGSVFGFNSFVSSISTVLNLGNVLLCDSINANNNFTMSFTSSGLGTFNSTYQVSSCDVVGTAPNMNIKFYNYDVSTGSSSSIKLFIPNYANGSYSWNGGNSTLLGLFVINGITYNVNEVSPSSGSTNIINAAPVGGFIEGGFSGQVVLTAAGSPPLTGNLSTSFNIYRNY